MAAAFVVAAVLNCPSGNVSASTLPASGPDHPDRPMYSDQLAAENGGPSLDTDTGVMPYQTYTDWSWPVEPHVDTEQVLTINSVDFGSHYFWAHDFHVSGDDGGYVGLQIGSAFSHSRVALFSIWGADKTDAGNCHPFDHEGSGQSCVIDPYRWSEGRSYTLRVAVDGTDDTGTWYKATVRDRSSGILSTIGRIHHPSLGATMVARGSWTEWFGTSFATCRELKRSDVTWGRPTANKGSVSPSSYWNHAEPKDDSTECRGSGSATDVSGGSRHTISPK